MNLINLFAVAVVSFFSSAFGSNETKQNLDLSASPRLSSGETYNISYSENDEEYFIRMQSWSPNLANFQTTSHASVTLCMNSYYSLTYSLSYIRENDIYKAVYDVLNTNNHLSSFIYGFYDCFEHSSNSSLFTRYYFVNPTLLGYGTFYFEDVTLHNLYDLFSADAEAYNVYGRWQSVLTLPFDLNIIQLEDEDPESYCDIYAYSNSYELSYFSSLASIEPQRHYGNTYTVVGNNAGAGQNIQDHLSFLPYYYLMYCTDDGTLGDFHNFNSDVSLQFYKYSSYLEAYNDGYNQGYADGQDAGYEEGRDIGYEYGYDTGQSEGYQSGYSDGYTEADNQDATAVAIFTGIIDVGLIPINFFLAMLNFEVFGINIGGMVASFLTIAIVVIIIRVVTGNKNDD